MQTEQCAGCDKVVGTGATIETPNGKGLCLDCVASVQRKLLSRYKSGARRRRV